MDPYLNVGKKKYPATLVVAAENDDRLDLWQSTKYIAAIQAKSTANYPYLLYIDKEASHGSSPNFVDTTAKMFAFALQETGGAFR